MRGKIWKGKKRKPLEEEEKRSVRVCDTDIQEWLLYFGIYREQSTEGACVN